MSLGLLVLLATVLLGASSAVILYLWRDDSEPDGSVKPGFVRREIPDLKHWEQPRLSERERQLTSQASLLLVEREASR